MTAAKQTNIKYWIHTIIGLVLMFGIQHIPPVAPITEIGMQIGGIFIGAIYLWSTVGTFWPSLIGILALAFTDYADMDVMFGAFTGFLPLIMLFSMILFGAVGDCGLTHYIARWFLTRKVINGRPSVFNFFIMLAAFVVSAFIDPLMALLVLWPSLYVILDEVGYTAKDEYSKILVVATFLAVVLGQCTMPFFGGQLVILGAFEAATGIPTDYGAYILFNIVTSVVIILATALLIKFVLRPDMQKMASITIEQINKNPLPPMNLQQKIYTVAALSIVVFALAPSILPAEWAIVGWMNRLNLVGFTMLVIALLVIIQVDGKPVLDPVHITKEYVMWDLYLLVVLAVFLSNCLLDDATGIKPFLIQLLNPIFEGRGTMFFMIFMIVFGALLTNVANNAVSGAVLMQVIAALSPSLGIDNPAPLAMTVTMAMFLAILTPAASPYAAVLHSNKERVSMGDIGKYGVIFMVLATILYIVIGLPLANILF